MMLSETAALMNIIYENMLNKIEYLTAKLV
jgi:hypothetical protein